jgi:hypothetical protein
MHTDAHEIIWTSKQTTAIEKLAEGVLTHDEIAAEVGVNPSTLTRWKGSPGFQDAVESAKAAHRAAIRAEGVANKQNLLDALNDRWAALKTIVSERGASKDMKGVPGGKTGFIVKTYKAVGFGPDMQMVEEHAVDTGLLKSFNDIEKQGAQLAGIWEDKLNVSGSLKREYVIVTETEGDE